jgi:hypothetical protein
VICSRHLNATRWRWGNALKASRARQIHVRADPAYPAVLVFGEARQTGPSFQKLIFAAIPPAAYATRFRGQGGVEAGNPCGLQLNPSSLEGGFQPDAEPRGHREIAKAIL